MKPWFLSKTLWVNLITTVVMTLEATQVLDLMSDEQLKVAAAVVAFLNIVLRVHFTETKLVK